MAVVVDAKDVDGIVAWVSFQILVFRGIFWSGGRVGIEHVYHIILLKSLLGHLPEGKILLLGAKGVAPPKFVLSILLPRAEDNRYSHPVWSFERFHKLCHLVEPSQESLVLAPVFHNVFDGTAFYRVLALPRDGDHSATVVLIDDFLTDELEWSGVGVERVARLDAPNLEAYEGRHVTANGLDIRAGAVVCPTLAIERGVLVPEEVALLGNVREVIEQILRALGPAVVAHRVVGFLLATRE